MGDESRGMSICHIVSASSSSKGTALAHHREQWVMIAGPEGLGEPDPGWQMTVFSLGPHVAFSLCAHPWCLFFL